MAHADAVAVLVARSAHARVNTEFVSLFCRAFSGKRPPHEAQYLMQHPMHASRAGAPEFQEALVLLRVLADADERESATTERKWAILDSNTP
jgi:hypothetical protein